MNNEMLPNFSLARGFSAQRKPNVILHVYVFVWLFKMRYFFLNLLSKNCGFFAGIRVSCL